MLKLFLWLRYLRKKKIVFLSIAAVALSSALLIIVSSLFTGFINAFEQSAVEAVGDVVLVPPVRFAEYPLLIERLEQTGAVEAATAMLSGQGLLHLGGGNVRAVNVWGIEPARRVRVTGFKQFLLKQKKSAQKPSFEVPGFADRVGGCVGIGVVAKPNEKTDEYDFDSAETIIGKQVILTTGAVMETEAGGEKKFKRKTLKFTVLDIVFTGVYEFDKKFIYLPIEQLQEVLYPNEDGLIASQIQIKLADGVRASDGLAQIRDVWQRFAAKRLGWGPYLIKQTTITTAKQLQSQYVAEFRKQMGILLLIFGVISCSVVLLVFCIFYMIVETRQRDIAIIKSCGGASSSVASVFVGFGACIGIIGSGFGAILGCIVTKNINTIEECVRIIFLLKLWKSSVYMFSKIPSQIDWASALSIVLLAVIAAISGALIPAIIAVRTKPVDILRYE
ncbi:MAG TPA: FtsX-like permease family protein [Phycisphaerales bacterium]|nr:FtsX-like permease family protein [Phycisphaerales bacterium]